MKVSTFSGRVWLWWVLFPGFACGTQDVRAVSGGSAQRGVVTVRGPSVKALAVGPMVLHAFSEFPGGAIYVAPVITGTDQDCDLRGHSDHELVRAKVEADRRAMLSVNAGEVACLVTHTQGSFELLWHAVGERPAGSAQLAVVPPARR